MLSRQVGMHAKLLSWERRLDSAGAHIDLADGSLAAWYRYTSLRAHKASQSLANHCWRSWLTVSNIRHLCAIEPCSIDVSCATGLRKLQLM